MNTYGWTFSEASNAAHLFKKGVGFLLVHSGGIMKKLSAFFGLTLLLLTDTAHAFVKLIRHFS
jgi:hypothetical protein